jgi:hypothetical protein
MILYRDIEKRFWEFGLEHGIRIIRKQRPAVVRYRKPRTARNYYVLGFICGFIPYAVHMNWIL